MKIVVIGAGILVVYVHTYSKAGHKVTLIEKGIGVGGRMSTRRMNGAALRLNFLQFAIQE